MKIQPKEYFYLNVFFYNFLFSIQLYLLREKIMFF